MPDPVSATVGSAVVGGFMQNRAASKQAAAMNQQAAAQVEAARIAAEEARFRPVGITTRFGSATPQFNEEGRLSGYTYQATPELQALQNQLSGLYGGSLGQAERAAALQPQFEQAATGLFGLGQQYMAQTPEELRQRYMQQQMDVLRPYDVEEEQRLAASVFGRGRGGLSVGAGGQPELKALAESRRRRDLQLAAGAEQAAQQQLDFGTGLFNQAAGLLGTGYQTQQAALSPFQAQFQLGTQLEDIARQPMDIGTALGQQVTSANARAGELLSQGMSSAAQLQSAGQQAKASGLASLGQGVAGLGQQYAQYQQQQEQNQILRDWLMSGRQPTVYSQPASMFNAPVNQSGMPILGGSTIFG